MSADDHNSTLVQFQTILNKLKKKRMLKKPNLNEAFEQFENLGNKCDREELSHFAGVCYQNAAKCQSSLGYFVGEGYLLRKSGRQFIKAELEYVRHGVISTEECLHNSSYCYSEAAKTFENLKDMNIPNTKPLSGSVMLEVAEKLTNEMHKPDNAAEFYKQAITLYEDAPIEKILSLQKLAICKLQSGNYDDALSVYNNLAECGEKLRPSGYKQDLLRDVEITRLLLLLLLQPTPLQLTSSTAGVLEKYAWVDSLQSLETDLKSTLTSHGLTMLNEDTFLCLQSLVMSCQARDIQSLILLQDQLELLLNRHQRHLLRVLLESMLRRIVVR